MVTHRDGNAVEHPPHYNWHPNGIECMDVVEGFDFLSGNVIKYVWRAGRKPDGNATEDLRKAREYLDRQIDRIERMGRSTGLITTES